MCLAVSTDSKFVTIPIYSRHMRRVSQIVIDFKRLSSCEVVNCEVEQSSD